MTVAVATALLVMGTADAGEAANPAAKLQPIEAAPVAIAPAPAAEELVIEVDAACEDADVSSNASTLADDPMIAPEAAKTEAAGCKPCKGRTWCKCTYNGMPRSSCDPCCYRNNIGVQICLD